VLSPWGVEALAVRIEHRAELKELMPVPIIAASRLTTTLVLPRPISAISFLKPWRSTLPRAGFAEILVDDVNVS
jgi:hypothetical protein